MKLNPAVRTGLIWAGVHQVWALLCVAVLWQSKSILSFLSSWVVMLADFPILLAAAGLGIEEWQPPLSNLLPSDLRNSSGLIATIFLLGGLQWFLIGYAVGAWRSKRKTRELKPQNLV